MTEVTVVQNTVLRKLVLATRNNDKIVEIGKLLQGLDVQLLSLDAFPEAPDVLEDGDTLEANAIKKAREIAEYTGLAAVADDTGLEVDCLHGAPGVYSGRYAGENVSYSDNVNKLLDELHGVPWEERKARFRCVVALHDNGMSKTVEGGCEGIICEKPQGSKGFGYDPVFFVQEYGKTFAEMELADKNTVSHRGIAFKRFRQLVEEQWFK